MSMLKCLAGAAFPFFACLGIAAAETVVSQSNAPRAALGASLAALMGTERDALGGLDAGRVARIAAAGASGGAIGGATVTADAGAGATGPGGVTEDRIAGRPDPGPSSELDCLARAVYFEARGESLKGQVAVAEVVLNRAASPDFPGTICAVVEQGARDGEEGCQFSYTCDGRPDTVTDRAAFADARRIAALLIGGAERRLTGGATYFHNASVRPAWAVRFVRTAVIGGHSFYREALRTALN
ncbi:MAG: cell wall hydrolase [Paracoccaceae bacterium]